MTRRRPLRCSRRSRCWPRRSALGACGGASRLAARTTGSITPPAYVGAAPIADAAPPSAEPDDAPRRDVRAPEPGARRLGGRACAAGTPARATALLLAAGDRLPAADRPRRAPHAAGRARRSTARCRAAPGCSARRPDGRYIVGTFRLARSPGHACTTPDERGPRRLRVRRPQAHPRRFTEWWQVADTAGRVTGPGAAAGSAAPPPGRRSAAA